VVYINFDSARALRSEFSMFLESVRQFRSQLEEDLKLFYAVVFDRERNMWFIDEDKIISHISKETATQIWSIVTTFRERLDSFARATRQLIKNYDEVVKALGRIQSEAISAIFGAERKITAVVEPESTSPIVPVEYRDLYATVVIRVGEANSETVQQFIDLLRTRIISRLTLYYRVYDVRIRGYSRHNYALAMVSYDQGAVRIDALKGLIKIIADLLIASGIDVELRPMPQIRLEELVTDDRVDPNKVYSEVASYVEELRRRVAQAEGEVARPLEVRPYQVDAVASALTWLRTSGRALIEVPTGGGKTAIAVLVAYILGKYNEDLKLLMTTFRSDIVRQFGDYLADKLSAVRKDAEFSINYVYGGEIHSRCFRNGVEVPCSTRSLNVPDVIAATSASLYYSILFAYYLMDEVKRESRKVYAELHRLLEQGRLDEIARTAEERCAKRRAGRKMAEMVKSAASRGAISVELVRKLSVCIAYYNVIDRLTREGARVSVREINRRIKPKLMDMLVRVLYAPVAFNIDAIISRISQSFVKRAEEQVDALIEQSRRGSEKARQRLRTIIASALRLLLTQLYTRISATVLHRPEVLNSTAEDLSRIYERYLHTTVSIPPEVGPIQRAIIDLMRRVRSIADQIVFDAITSGFHAVSNTVRFRAIGRRLDYYSIAVSLYLRSQLSKWLGNIATPYTVRAGEITEEQQQPEEVQAPAESGEPVVIESDEVIEIEDIPKVEGEELVFTGINRALAYKLFRLRRKNVLIIIDEAHHTPASSIALLLLFFKRALVLGLTATPYRGDKLDMLIYGLAGSIVYSISSSELIGRGYLVPAYVYNIVYHSKDNNKPLYNVASTLIKFMDELRQAIEDYSHRLGNLAKLISGEGGEEALPPSRVKRELITAANGIADVVGRLFEYLNLSPLFDKVRELANRDDVLEEVLRTRSVDEAVRLINNKYRILRDIPVPDMLTSECNKPEFRDHIQCICTTGRNVLHTADLHSTTSDFPDQQGIAVAHFLINAYCSKYGAVRLITPEFLARLAVRLLALYAIAKLDERPDGRPWTSKDRISAFRRRLGGLMRSIEQARSGVYIRALHNDLVRNWMLADSIMQVVHGMARASKSEPKFGEEYTTYPFAIVTPWREGADRMYAVMVARVAAHCYTYSKYYGISPEDPQLLDKCLKRAKELVQYVHGDVPTDTRTSIYNALRKRKILGIVATTVLNEGIDIPSLSILAIHRGGRGRVGTKQVVGRGLRPYSDGRYTKRALILIDILDIDNPVGVASNRCRMTFYCVDEPMWVKIQISDDNLLDYKHARRGGYYTIPSPKLYYVPHAGVGSFFELVGYLTYYHQMPAIQTAQGELMYMPPYLDEVARAYGYCYARNTARAVRWYIFGDGKSLQSMLNCADVNSCIKTFSSRYDAFREYVRQAFSADQEHGCPPRAAFKDAYQILRECKSALDNVQVMVEDPTTGLLDYVYVRDIMVCDSSLRCTLNLSGQNLNAQRMNLARRLSACLAFNWAHSVSNCRVFAENVNVPDPLTAYLCTLRELYIIDADQVDVHSAIQEALRRYRYCGQPGVKCAVDALSAIRGRSPVCVMNLLYRIRSILRGPYSKEFTELLYAYASMYGVPVKVPQQPRPEGAEGQEEEGGQRLEEEEGEEYLADLLVNYLGDNPNAYIYALKELC